jgi:hypothetical protein
MKNENCTAIFVCHETEVNIESKHHDTSRQTHKPNIPKTSRKDKLKVNSLVVPLGFKLFWENLNKKEVN